MADQTTDTISEDASPFEQMKRQFRAEYESDPALDRLDLDVDSLCEELWDWSTTIDEKDCQFRLRSIETAHLLEVVGPDRPFLVDSLLGACAAKGPSVDALFHPIIRLDTGARRSLIQIHLPRLTEPEVQMLCDEVRVTLSDVDLATRDYRAMLDKMAEGIAQLEARSELDPRHGEESVAFLEWLMRDHFVFLGVRDYRFKTGEDGTVLPAEPDMVEDSNLGILRDSNRNVLKRGAEPLLLTSEIGDFLAEPEPIILAKATLVSRVHRRVPADYVGIKHFDENGHVTGETRFLGLYTSEAYNESICDIPLLRQRREEVLELTHSVPGSHNEKAITNVLEGWPRDELFQTESEELAPIILGAANLTGRPRVRLFVRPDRFGRFVSAILFVPRESYDTELRQKIAHELEREFGGDLAGFEPKFVGNDLVRVLFEITLPDDPPNADIDALEQRLVDLSKTWQSRYRAAIMAHHENESALRTDAASFASGFTAAYREAFSPKEAVEDVLVLSDLSEDKPVRLRAYRSAEDSATALKAKIYSRSGSIALSDCVPIFERMGYFVAFESGYPVKPSRKLAEDAPDTYWVHALSLRRADSGPVDLETVEPLFEDAFVAIWSGDAENDGFNALILNGGLSWREAALCRALCAYRHQTGSDPAKSTQIEALNAYPHLSAKLMKLFATRFDPTRGADLETRADAAAEICRQIDTGLIEVASLNHDRVIRRLSNLIMAISRTNFYQRDTENAPLPYISFKVESRKQTHLPAPKPYREIFVSSPQVEGVHCRFGAVARGGIRWSDRRDDFRTEVLGLVKAQQVKNSVIVPVGAKGGFFAKQLPDGSDAQARKEAGIAAYRTYISALLCLTDNLIDGKLKRPSGTVVWDEPDPYLVVAADKGTATFSDIANEISEDLGFWLGDAFASGGSTGYDHKKMGITARGAWEAVKRHFRERGKDIQSEPFDVIGVGDMSGDVFGNGMLLSRKIRLLAAFNHKHIFVDPNPQDTDVCWDERKRLFDSPGLGWDSYNADLISAGGGVFDRSAKSIELTDEIRALTGLTVDSLTPDELIHALLKADCELLWFGGIGTYAKASSESHADADDRSNDAVRVDAVDLNAKVIGEGANLGMTQAARVEFALNGGAINTDAVDNSGGVDSSDHEVNIKILCKAAIDHGELDANRRNDLLAELTDEVAEHVLEHNYDQTLALSIATTTARQDHDAYERLMSDLESREGFDRAVEGLPDTIEMQTRREEDQPLTRPEIAPILAWSKIILFDDLVASRLPDDPHFNRLLQDYFPKALRGFGDALESHRLRREIIATILSNRTMDLGGPLLFYRLIEETKKPPEMVVRAIELACELAESHQIDADINALDNKIPADAQLLLRRELAAAVIALARSLLDFTDPGLITETLNIYKQSFKTLRGCIPDRLSDVNASRLNQRRQQFLEQGAPESLADELASASLLEEFPRLHALAKQTEHDLKDAFAAHERIGEALGTEALIQIANAASETMESWDLLATKRLIQDLAKQQINATHAALKAQDLDSWLEENDEELSKLGIELEGFETRQPGFAQLALAADAIRDFVIDDAT